MIILLMTGTKMLLPEGKITTAITFMLMGLWITYGAPAMFTWLAEKQDKKIRLQ